MDIWKKCMNTQRKEYHPQVTPFIYTHTMSSVP